MAEAADGSDDVQSNASSEPTDFPKVARTRMNLTALSQQYDVCSPRPAERWDTC